MSSKSPSIESSAYLLFGTFLSGLIIQDFIKEASITVYTSFTGLFFVISGGTWIFFAVFDALIWLLYLKDNQPKIEEPDPWKLFLHLFRRIIEFGSLIWLYDITNIVKKVGGLRVFQTQGFEVLQIIGLEVSQVEESEAVQSLARFSLDLATMCFAWFIRRSLQPFLGSYKKEKIIECDLLRNKIRLSAFSIAFFIFRLFIIHHQPSIPLAYIILSLMIIAHIIMNFRIGWESYYKEVFKYFSA